MRGVPRTVVFGETSHGALFQLFDPLDLPLKTIADIDGEPRVLGIEDVPFGATFKGVSVRFDKVLESGDSSIEFPYFSHMVGFSLFDCFEQGFGDALQGVGVKVSATVEDVGGRSGRNGVVGDRVPRWDGDR